MSKETMKAVTVYGPSLAKMEVVPKPRATGDMLVIKVKRTGVCATDLSIFTGESSFIRRGEIKIPCRFGHEWAGVVESLGEIRKNNPVYKKGDFKLIHLDEKLLVFSRKTPGFDFVTVVNNSDSEITLLFDKKTKELIQNKTSDKHILCANSAGIYKVSKNSEMEIG